MFLQKGGVKLSVVNGVGKEAVVAILGPGDFFGEGCLAGQAIRMGMATAITASTIHVIEESEMLRVLHEQHALSDQFISFMLARNIRIEEDLIDQLFNSSERSGWPALFCCLPVMARRAGRTKYPPRYHRKRWRR